MVRPSRQKMTAADGPRAVRTASARAAAMRRTSDVLAVVAIGSLAGVLIWTKLKLVSPVPRTAFADPPAETNAEANAKDNTEADAEHRPRTDASGGR